jgi:hypothetical protein
MRIMFNLRRGLLAAAMATTSLSVAALAQAQYAPYQAPAPVPAPVQYQQQAAVQPSAPYQQQAAAAQQQAQQYAAAQYAQQQAAAQQYAQQAAAAAQQAKTAAAAPYNAAQQYVAPQQQAATTPVYSPAQGYVQPQPYASTGGVPYVASRQNAEQVYPVTPPVDPQMAAPQEGGYPQPMAGADYAAPQAGSNGQPNPYAQAAAAPYEAYPGYNGGCNTCAPAGGRFGGLFAKHGCAPGCGYWFGGVYGLLMDRDNANNYPLTFAAPTMPAGGYPASSNSIVLSTRSVDVGYQPGVEFRLGRVFGGDPCNCCCGPQWGVEGVYWTLFDQDDAAYYTDDIALRTYTMMPMAGLEYDDGAGYRPVNQYYDYAPPASTNDIEVQMACVHNSFQVTNFELNLLRLNICGAACGGPALCNVGCDPCTSGGCGRRPGILSRYSCTGVCGFRYMEFDEDFMYGIDYWNTTTSTGGYLNYRSSVENKLIGAQIGCNGMYRIGCKWGIHMNTLVGLYGNDVNVRQGMISPTGQVRYIATGENFDVNADKTDVAMLGELRLGMSYQATCCCRIYGGWRAIGVTGIALATNQSPTQFLDSWQMSNYVNSNGSMILHGLQTGIEWNY